MSENLAKPKVGMLVRNKRSGSMYQVDVVEGGRVYLRPYWTGMNCRSTWKSITRLWCDCYRVDGSEIAPHNS